MSTLLSDARFALRLFARTPGFAALAVLTLADLPSITSATRGVPQNSALRAIDNGKR